VQHLHSKSIVHGDLVSTANLMRAGEVATQHNIMIRSCFFPTALSLSCCNACRTIMQLAVAISAVGVLY
jgi:hypothetical protein